MNRAQSGATLVEFSLVLVMFLTFMLGLLDFARLLYTWHAATEATRLGARFAVVCEEDTARTSLVMARMQTMAPEIEDIALQWLPAGCGPTSCEGVSVQITRIDFQWLTPLAALVPETLALPGFQTYLPRESMRQDPHSDTFCL